MTKKFGTSKADLTPVYIEAMHGFSIPNRPSWIRVEPKLPPDQAVLPQVESTQPPRRDETPQVTYSLHHPFPPAESPIRFGEWLIRRQLIQPHDLFEALNYAQTAGIRIGDAIVEQQLLERGQVELEALHHYTFIALYGGEPLSTCPF